MQHDSQIDRRHAQRRQALRDVTDHGTTAHHREVLRVKGFVADLDAPGPSIGFHSGRDFFFWIEFQGPVGLRHCGEKKISELLPSFVGFCLLARDVQIHDVYIVLGIQDADLIVVLFGRVENFAQVSPLF